MLALLTVDLAAHEFHEDVERVLPLKRAAFNADVSAVALDNAHSVAFHTGLGSPVYPTPSTPYKKYLNEEYIASYADAVYVKPNLAVVADGAAPENLSKWVEQFFKDVPASSQSGQKFDSQPSKYYGGEQRLSHTGGNAMVIAFPGSDYTSAKPEIAVLASLLGGQSTIKWTPGYSLLSKATSDISGLSVSASNLAYSDAGLLTVQLSGPAASVRKGAEATVKALESIANGSVSKEDVTKAIANAKFNALDNTDLREPTLHLVGSGIVNAGKAFEPASLVQGIESVTPEKLKTVSLFVIDYDTCGGTNSSNRLPRVSWMARRRSPLWVIFSCCRTLSRSVSGYRECCNTMGGIACTNSSRSSRWGTALDSSFVNNCSRILLFMCPLHYLGAMCFYSFLMMYS